MSDSLTTLAKFVATVFLLVFGHCLLDGAWNRGFTSLPGATIQIPKALVKCSSSWTFSLDFFCKLEGVTLLFPWFQPYEIFHHIDTFRYTRSSENLHTKYSVPPQQHKSNYNHTVGSIHVPVCKTRKEKRGKQAEAQMRKKIETTARTWHRRVICRACTRLWLACMPVSIFLARVVVRADNLMLVKFGFSALSVPRFFGVKCSI